MQRNLFFVFFLFGVVGPNFVDCTSGQNLHNLLKHPHYADGHQHSQQHYSQHSTFHPPHRGNGQHLGAGSFLKGSREAPTSGPWSRVGSKDYYKMSGPHSLKTTSVAKSQAIVDPRIPQELSDVREASDHFMRIRSGAYCQLPRAEVVCVRDLYPEKEFLPRCTLLHRCTQSTGCCEDDGLQCAPKAMQEVVLHFYVLGGDHLSSDVEKLLFVNHTECECKPKASLVTTTPATTSSSSTTTTTTTQNPEENAIHHNHPQRDQQNPRCRSCPQPFCARELEEGFCSCDCFDRHKPCIRIKRGREPLLDSERRCVLTGKCNVPDCEYGVFDSETGRCPKRPEHLGPREGDERRRPMPNHKNPNHRWIYFERD